MKPRQKRLAIVLGGLAAVGIAATLILNAFQSNLVFFFTPTQVAGGEAPKDRPFRIGGLVKEGSLQRNDITARFIVTDTAREIPVAYKGILPDLFSEGKGVVAQGTLGADGNFTASEVLAKHDENYMPPEAQAAVDKAHEASRTLKQ
ncbi:cytochrome c maturation protein CcmE [Zoogloea dura]|jgi:cytochrome c-type biogenesis protein CcmE|uniref:Cytochrome c-type biogenesis protein CcmE n=1 Tax=Zoogloea dura TaxID=2728840 RepID=A0A848G3L5_9RHOO|nr:cytochrome c maturation protein CcmE [Zoogloea dura]NML25812.1 cytochrome c maturation protein CcmE [Zoogloea dura]